MQEAELRRNTVEGRQSPGFNVRVERASSLVDWLHLQRRFQDAFSLQPMGAWRLPPSLFLGSKELADPVLSEVLSAIEVRPAEENYSLYVSFMPSSPNNLHFDGTPFEKLPALNAATFIAMLIQEEGFNDKYKIDHKQPSDSLSIFDQNNNAVFEFKAVRKEDSQNEEGGAGYILNFTGSLVPEEVTLFPQYYSAMGDLTKYITEALYRAHGKVIPDEELVLRPPFSTDKMVSDTTALVTQLEESLRRALNPNAVSSGQYL